MELREENEELHEELTQAAAKYADLERRLEASAYGLVRASVPVDAAREDEDCVDGVLVARRSEEETPGCQAQQMK